MTWSDAAWILGSLFLAIVLLVPWFSLYDWVRREIYSDKSRVEKSHKDVV